MNSAYGVDVPLRWSDMDAYAHVNNVQFLRLLEDARVMGLRDWFPGVQSKLDAGIIVSRHEIEYLAPLIYRPAPVHVRMWVTAIHAVGYDLAYEIADPAGVGERVYAVAATGMVLYDFAGGRPRRMTPEERAGLEAHRGPEVPFRWSRRGPGVNG